jgi:hypothetical protein
MADVDAPYESRNGAQNTPAYLISGHESSGGVGNVSGGGVQNDEFDDGNSTARLFERTRIQVLAVERELVQKKTFTKWVNSHLIRSGYGNSRVQDLYIDLRDGRVLLRLLEILSSERLPRPTRGKMRIHCLENVDKALLFLQEQHVHLENIGAHDIVDGNGSLTLGLIWTIILRFQIQIIDEEYLRRTEIPSKYSHQGLFPGQHLTFNQAFPHKNRYILGLGPGCEPKPKTKVNSEFNSLHFGIEINKL